MPTLILSAPRTKLAVPFLTVRSGRWEAPRHDVIPGASATIFVMRQPRLEAGAPATRATQRTPHAAPYTDLQAS